jgi:hypothetical protein
MSDFTIVNDPYRAALRLFEGKDENRPALLKPFYQDDFVFATDAHAIIMFKKELLTIIDFEPHPKAPNALAVIPEGSNKNIEFETAYLKGLVAEVDKKTDELYDVIKHACPDCQGRGYVDFTFTDYTHSRHEMEGVCPTCEEDDEFYKITSIKTGDEIDVFDKLIQIEDRCFKTKLISQLVSAAELLSVQKVVLVCKIANNACHKFQVGECIICMMPVNEPRDADVIVVA